MNNSLILSLIFPTVKKEFATPPDFWEWDIFYS